MLAAKFCLQKTTSSSRVFLFAAFSVLSLVCNVVTGSTQDVRLPLELSRLLSDVGGTGEGGRPGGAGLSALVDVSETGVPREKFLRSFCRYCHSQPFFCGELLELCYARARMLYAFRRK